MQPVQYTSSNTRSRKKLWILVIGGIVGLMILYFAAPVLTVMFVVQPIRIEGRAMEPTLNNGDRVFINKRIGEPNRDDIVVFLYPKDQSKSYIKRIIGLRGESVKMEDGRVIINGKRFDEPYIGPEFFSHDSSPEPVTIPADHYFVLGDNRNYSSDSRSWGTVPRNLILGKFWYRYRSAKEAER
jgi:signal peptidase I